MHKMRASGESRSVERVVGFGSFLRRTRQLHLHRLLVLFASSTNEHMRVASRFRDNGFCPGMIALDIHLLPLAGFAIARVLAGWPQRPVSFAIA
jgi:hypothetical protein